jgi:phosphoadenosine phosphosulfate reductase
MRPDFIAPTTPAEPVLVPGSVADRVATLNARYRHHGATAVLEHALTDGDVGRIALVSSFGAESVVLLHLVSVMDRGLPVLFIDTEMLFAETLTYQLELTERLRLRNVQVVQPDRAQVFERDNEGLLHLYDPDACCALRKTEPLQRALKPYDAWITGRKRYQGRTRQNLDFFEAEGEVRIKVNPLVHWTSQDLQDYIAENRLPRHPLVAKGYPSIGCQPCTTRVGDGEDPRAGRWRDLDKEECGIHFINGRLVRGPAARAG